MDPIDLKELPDEELACLATQDREDAFRTLYDRHRNDVYRFAIRLLGDRELARDAVQETFLRVYRFLDCYDPARPFRPWLLRVAHNTGLNTLRQAKGKPEGDAADRAISERVTKAVSASEATYDVQRALETLADEQRALLLQRYGMGLKLTELAETWEVTERTVRNRLHAATDALTRSLLKLRHQGGQP